MAGSKLQSRMSEFVGWIRTDDQREDDIRTQVAEIRSRIKGQADGDGLTVRSTPDAGSFAKRTGLRRHLLGDSDVEGQDVDLPFVVSPKSADGERLDELLGLFDRYAKASYPNTARKKTKSSVRLEFVGTKLNYDLVPMLAAGKQDEQVLLRGDRQKRRTSVQKHVDFVRRRTEKSNAQFGVVMFNECIRLVKWWKEFRVSMNGVLTADELPTFPLELLAAAAFDRLGVRQTYAETLHQWFGWLANVVSNRQQVAFTDYGPFPARTQARWDVMDPVNPENNVAEHLTGPKIDELADWFAKGRDRLAMVLAADRDRDDGRAVDHLVELFGNPFRKHCEKEQCR